MFLRRLFPFLVLSILVGSGCGKNDSSIDPPGPDVVASFEGGMITKAQLKDRFNDLMPCCKGRYEGETGARALIKEMVLPDVIAKTIKQKKIDFRENIREEMGNLTDELNVSFLHIKFHEQILNSNKKYKDLRESNEYQKKILKGVPLSERFNRLTKFHQKIHPQIAKEVEEVSREYIRKLRREASITRNLDVLKINITQEELKDFYQKHKEGLHGNEYMVPDRVKVREISIKVEKNGEDCPKCKEKREQEAKEKAESALTQLRSGADFERVVQEYSNEVEKSTESRWISINEEEKEMKEVVESLEVGELSPVFKKGDSFHIVKVLNKQPGRFKTYDEIIEQLEREYRWQKGEDYLKDNRDRILFTMNGRQYTIEDFRNEYNRSTPPHQCHHTMKETDSHVHKEKAQEQCDLAHNDFEEQKKLVDRMIDRELIVEDTYNQMIHVEHQKEIEFMTMASLYPIFHKEEMENLIHVTDEMVKDYYKRNKEEYLFPARAKISMILIKGGEKEEERKRAFEKARKAYGELKPSFFSFKKDKDFAEVARAYSEDEETAPRGGRIEVDVYECRNAVEYALLHGFHKKIFQLSSGEISDIFRYGNDYYILQINEMEERKQKTFEEIKEQVKRDLMDKKHEDVMEDWEKGLLRTTGFVVYDQPLREALAETVAKEPKEVKGS